MLGLWPNSKRIGANALAKLKGPKIERVGVNKKNKARAQLWKLRSYTIVHNAWPFRCVLF